MFKFDLTKAKILYQPDDTNLKNNIEKFEKKYHHQIINDDYEILRELHYAYTRLSIQVGRSIKENKNEELLLVAINIGQKIIEFSKKLDEQIISKKLRKSISIEKGNAAQFLASSALELKTLSSSKKLYWADFAIKHAKISLSCEIYDERNKKCREEILLKCFDAYCHQLVNDDTHDLHETYAICMDAKNYIFDKNNRPYDITIAINNLRDIADVSLKIYKKNKDIYFLKISYNSIIEALNYSINFLNDVIPNQKDKKSKSEFEYKNEHIFKSYYNVLLIYSTALINELLFFKAIDISENFLNNYNYNHEHIDIELLYSALGKSYLSLKNYLKAIEYYKLALKAAEKTGIPSKINSVAHMLSNCHWFFAKSLAFKGKINEAINEAKTALNYAERFLDKRKAANCCELLAELNTHNTINKFELAKAYIKNGIYYLKEYFHEKYQDKISLLDDLTEEQNLFCYYSKFYALVVRLYYDHSFTLDEINSYSDIHNLLRDSKYD